MALVPAKCTQCGANIEIDDTKEAGICQYCGTAFITEKAITNYNTYITNNNNFSGAVINVSNGIDIDAYFELIDSAISVGDINEAKKYLDEILKFDSRNAAAWKIKAQINNGKEEILCVTNAIRFADSIEKVQIKNDYYTKWAKRCMLNERCYFNALPKEDVKLDKNLQDIIINTARNEIQVKTNNWADRKRRMADLNIINNEIRQFNILVRSCIDKLPDNRKTELQLVDVYTGACYIATCVYGSYDCPQVWTLRRFRDYTLDETWYGRAFIKCYYTVSPILVKWFGSKLWFRTFWKYKLDKMVADLNDKGVEDTYYNDKY